MILQGDTIYLRMLEPSDYELTYLWHNDYNIQKLTCGPLRIVSKEIERNWVLAKSSNNREELYLAICMNDTDKMVGYVSLNNFNYLYRSCSWSGIVIGDKNAHSGFEYIEAGVLLIAYVFDQLNMNRLTASVIEKHITSNAGLQALTLSIEGIAKEAVYKDGQYFDRVDLALLRSEYINHKLKGDYETFSVMSRMSNCAKILKKGR